MSIKIIIDSTTDISPRIKDRITAVIPTTVRFGDKEYIDGVELSRQRFYELLFETDALPATSMPTPDSFMRAYGEASKDGSEILVITISGKLSGTHQSAVIAAEDFDNVTVVDSKSVAIGVGILVELAVKLIDEGKTVAEIAAILEEMREQVAVIALLDTLEYLKKGGRISPAVAFAGAVLNLKPVVCMHDGECTMLGKARGSKQGNNLLITEIEKCGGVDYSLPVMLGYTGISDALLMKYIEDSKALWDGKVDPLEWSHVSGTVGAHLGPGCVAAAFFMNNQTL